MTGTFEVVNSDTGYVVDTADTYQAATRLAGSLTNTTMTQHHVPLGGKRPVLAAAPAQRKRSGLLNLFAK